jgi:chemotaxis protein methyltransferase CheR
VLAALIEALTIGETHFFRNQPQFQALTETILPGLIAARRAERRLRIWSAGCATGEEPYSLAMALEDLLPDLDQWQVLILATDINRQSLAKAQRGVYSQWSFRGVTTEQREKFFTPQGRDFVIAPRIRQRVTFAYLNLVEDVYPTLLTNTTALDLILFRNVLIYFSEATTQRIVPRLHAALAEGGWLVVGHADNLPGAFARFTVHNFPGTVVYQKLAEPPAPLQPAPAKLVAPAPLPLANLKPAAPRVAPRPQPAPSTPATAATPTVTYEQAVALAERGQVEGALTALAALAAAQPREARPCYLAAKLEANRQNLAAAEAHIATALERAPLWAQAHYLRGLILQAGGQLPEAAEAMRRSVYADPEFVLGHFALAGLLAQQGQGARAEKSLANVTRLLAGRPRGDLIPEGDGLTVGRLLDLAAVQKAGA